MLTAKKYMSPIFLFHPYAAGAAVAVYVQHWHFNPGKDALIFDSKHQLSAALKSADRRVVQDQLEELVRAASPADANADRHQWTSLYAAAERALDAVGAPTLRISDDSEVTFVGIARIQYPERSGGFRIRRGHDEGTLARRTEICRRPKDGSRRCRERSVAAASTASAAAEAIGDY